MKKFFCFLAIFMAFLLKANAQYETVQVGEYGITAGVAHYFGDLNNRGSFNRPKIALGAFFRKQVNNYAAVRLADVHTSRGSVRTVTSCRGPAPRSPRGSDDARFPGVVLGMLLGRGQSGAASPSQLTGGSPFDRSITRSSPPP